MPGGSLVIVPEPDFVTTNWNIARENVAGCVTPDKPMVMMHVGLLPLQGGPDWIAVTSVREPPLSYQPRNAAPGAAAGNSVTKVPRAKLAVQDGGQLIFAGLLTIVPEPLLTTVSSG